MPEYYRPQRTRNQRAVGSQVRRSATLRAKEALIAIGARTPKRYVRNAQVVIHYLLLGRWMRDHGFVPDRYCVDREDCFDAVAQAIGDNPVLCLEFGVYQGAGLAYWASVLKHGGTRLHGFDSFEGLPEAFDEHGGAGRGAFDLGGVLPQLSDERIELHRGWFEDVLPTFEVEPHSQLIIALDADLYSSTRTVLRCLERWIAPGTFIYFDEMSHVQHEARAFHEFMADTGKRFTLFAATRDLNRCVFRCTR
jgi:O-methyltransferase